MRQHIIAYVNYDTKCVHIGEHHEFSKTKKVENYKYQAEYAKRNHGKKGSAHAFQSGFIYALMNSELSEWFEIDYGFFDTLEVNVKAKKKEIAEHYEGLGFKIITAHLDADYRGGKGDSKIPSSWHRISANLPRPKFMAMCEKMFYSSGINTSHAFIQRSFNDAYHWVVDKYAPDRTKADVRVYFVRVGLLP